MQRLEVTLYLYDCSRCGKPRQTKKENHAGVCRKCKAQEPVKGQELLFN